MNLQQHIDSKELLLTRRGLVYLTSTGPLLPDHVLQALEIEFAEIGYVFSSRLRQRLARCQLHELSVFSSWAINALLAHIGGDRKHEPLFSNFPNDVPEDTLALWWKKVLNHFLQAEGQPCLFCRRTGTTHVLNPCKHVVCDQCFDGANYTACPVCEHHVDRSSPFFKSKAEKNLPSEKIIFKLLDAGDDATADIKMFFVSLCERKQALSPADHKALEIILQDYGTEVLDWLPETIPIRENIAVIFGTLFQKCEHATVFPHARRFMKTATDVLRFIAVLSGADGSLIRETIFKSLERTENPSSFWGRLAGLLGGKEPVVRHQIVTVPLRVSRFKVAPISRSLRRTLLALLEEIKPEQLFEDMLRHRSYWVWVGQFLHPHEYAARFPTVAKAFLLVRKKAPDGSAAPKFQGWYSKLERAIREKDADGVLAILAQRPGEFVRRFDHALRMVNGKNAEIERLMTTFSANLPAIATPVLLTLRNHFPKRHEKTRMRVYWPKGRVANGVFSTDERPVLSSSLVERVATAINIELLNRFARKPCFKECIVDEALQTIRVPFNERTASLSAISLPRGSSIAVPDGKVIRLFLHWCQPEQNDQSTDLDLSVAFYDEDWKYMGVCSYYQLKYTAKYGDVIATSAGDLRDAPWPDGATEFIDVNSDVALSSGIRYAVMVVNNYAGMPFSLLDRGFAGLMLRDDVGGKHFDPRTVELKFSIMGENGIFMPLVLDIQNNVLHWIDVQAKGKLEMNNVETSKKAIATICPELLAYFSSGIRPSMWDLALLHAASRCDRIIVRGKSIKNYIRRPDEKIQSFYQRLIQGQADEQSSKIKLDDGTPVMAFLYSGDIDLPKGSNTYSLFRHQTASTIAASDLLS